MAGAFTANASESDLFAGSAFILGSVEADGAEAVFVTSTPLIIGQRGSIAYDQIKASDRTGNGNQLLTYSPAPASATSPGTPGQVAFDEAGYWYFCYGVNQRGRIGPTGYGSATASPPSW